MMTNGTRRFAAICLASLGLSLSSVGCASRFDPDSTVELKRARVADSAADAESARAALEQTIDRLFEASKAPIAGARVHVEAPLIDAIAGPLRDRRVAFARFARLYAHTIHAEGLGDRPAAEALEHGPIDVDGVRYPTLGRYLDRITANESERRSPRRLTERLVERMAARVRDRDGDVAAIRNRPAALLAVRRQALEYRDHSPMHASSARELRARSVRFVVRSTLRRSLTGYRLDLVIHDLSNGSMHHAGESIDPLYTRALDRVTTGQE